MTGTEKWRAVKGYEGIYSISSFGRIRRDKKNQGTKPRKFLRPYLEKNGYLRIDLRNYGRKTFLLHRLVCENFIGPCPSGHQVNHKDLNKENNHLENLEYLTHQQNMIHANNNGKITGWPKRSVLRLSDHVLFDSLRKVTEEVGGTVGHLWSVLNGKRKTFKGEKYIYADGGNR